jgi:polysaccharide biosynthesis/export protein
VRERNNSFVAMCLALGLSSSFLTACSGGGLPQSGPSTTSIVEGTTKPTSVPYELVKLDGEVAAKLHYKGTNSLGQTFGMHRPAASIQFGVGDLVGVTIFESAGGGLFLPAESGNRSGNFVQIPDQTIDKNGNITVPYAGAVKAAGRSAADIQRSIQGKLANRAIEPQAVVTMKEQRSAFISVLGEVNNPARLALSGGGERIADSLARAGGPKARGFETTVTVQRGEKRGTANLLDVVNSDDNNIFLQPGDTVYVKSEARTFLAFGATGESGQFDFLKERITLAEAIGKARGLLDERAEPSSVFLYRLETRDRAKSIGIDISKWGDSDTIPIIYSLNLRDPSGFFVAGLVPMQPADILYIDNASSVNFNKFLSLVFNATNVVRATRLTANGL